MKIKVKDIEPNPFRKMKEYPIDKEKVEALKTSIQEKSFWDNILVRKNGAKFQLAYGHHRWIALKELGIEEIDIPVRRLDDVTMLRIMAEENLNWSTSTAMMTQTVLVVKDFLDSELQKYDTLATSEEIFKGLFDNQRAFETAKGMGVGRHTLIKFLGGNWTDYKIEVALNIIKDKTLDKSARDIPTIGQARVFQENVRKYKIPKPVQKKIVKTVINEGVGKRDIPKLVRDHALIPKDEDKSVTEIQSLIEKIDSQSRALYNIILSLRKQMKQMEVTELEGVKVWLAKSSLKKLINEFERLNNETDK